MTSVLELCSRYPWLIRYLLTINIITFLAFAWDKTAAIGHRRRIRESVLLGLACIGGPVGGLVGMCVCRHKTRKVKFRVVMPVVLVVWVTVLWRIGSM